MAKKKRFQISYPDLPKKSLSGVFNRDENVSASTHEHALS